MCRRPKTGQNTNQGLNSVNKIKHTHVRKTLDDLIRQSGEDYTAISLMLKRNKAYIQQFIKRGSPRTLAETDRKMLAAHFGVSETTLGAPQKVGENISHPLHMIPALNDLSAPDIAISRNAITQPPLAPTTQLKYCIVDDHSMSPTLMVGDTVVINTDDCAVDCDGLYVWLHEDCACIRRATFNPVEQTYILSCDGPNQPDIKAKGVSLPHASGRIVFVIKPL